MPSFSPMTTLQAGLLSVGMSTGLIACGSVSMDGRDGGDASRRDASSDTLRDSSSDGSRDSGDAGRCPQFSFNPPHALRFRAYDIRYGGTGTPVAQTTVPFGGSFVNAALVLPVNPPAASDASVDASALSGTPSFVGLLQLGGMPFELSSTDDRVRRRVNGDPLARLTRPGFANWEEAFPGVQDIGFAYTVEGRIDPAACTLNLRLLGAVNRTAGLATNQPQIALPFYAPRADGRYDMASADFSNESVAVFMGGLSINFPLRTIPATDQPGESAVITVCDNAGATACPAINGSGLRRLEVVVTNRPSVPAAVDAGVEGGTDASLDTGDANDAGSDVRPDTLLDSRDSGDSGITVDSGSLGDARPDVTDAARSG